METPNLPAIRALRPTWNKGRIVGQKRPLKPKHVWAIMATLHHGTCRDLRVVNPGMHAARRRIGVVLECRTLLRRHTYVLMRTVSGHAGSALEGSGPELPATILYAAGCRGS